MAPPPAPPSPADRTPQPSSRSEDRLLALDLDALSRRVPKRRLVLYFGRSTFADNTKYLYLRDVARQKGHEALWCTIEPDLARDLRDHGLPSVDLTEDVDRSIDLLLHAAVAVFCVNPAESLRGSESLYACLAGARTLQLWHGVSVKHLLLRLIPHLGVRDTTVRQAFTMASRTDVVVSTASTFDRFWAECFGCRRVARAGLPRNEVLLRAPSEVELLGADPGQDVSAALAAGGKNVLVVPTWQRGKPTPLTEPDFLKLLLAIAQRGKVNIFCKMHPMLASAALRSGARAPGFYMLETGLDVYPLLPRFDLLVTDYSSIMFDYLLTTKPVLTLELGPDGHQRFEPDFTLVPDVPYRYTFDPADFEATMRHALYDDDLSAGRQAMVDQIFESDPLRAGEHLLELVDRLVDEVVDDDLVIERPSPAHP
jgi:CDP-glycerol glycerophosphotransferase